ncbi:MAG: hypothetical protein IMX01_00460 [Limnochordaceae bacterium]|nr:hypothetical protein [Limnochordaceae bacterium]
MVKSFRAVMTVASMIVAAAAWTAPALAEQKPVSVVAVKATQAPVIDGKLDDAAWIDAALAGSKMGGFVTNTGDAISAGQTIVFVTWDDQNLYVAYKNYRQDMSKLAASMTDPGSPVWNEDDNELFIDPANDKTSFIQFAWNALGTKWSGLGDYESWQVATSKDNQSWTSEVAIPWSLLGVTPAEGLTIGANFTSHDIQADQWNCWSPTFGSFLNAARFGEVTLAAAYVKPE